MILQYFKKKENEYKIISDKIYLSSLELTKKIMSKNYFKLNNFDSSFEILSIILIFNLKYSKDWNDKKHILINENIIKNLINDLDKSLRDLGISDMQIGKYVKKFVKKFYFRLKKIDLILNNFSKKKFEDYLMTIKNIDINAISELAADLIIIRDIIKKNTENAL